MPLAHSFVSPQDAQLEREFLAEGYVIRDVADLDALNQLRDELVASVARQLDCPVPNRPDAFLDTLHERLTIEKLNPLRLAV
ncbi:MAG: hypothetical protein JO021_25600, partial [Alphaproteobacteria bacterium]|nr:hypothetical protein [Alphaproteobacteria bacterium]